MAAEVSGAAFLAVIAAALLTLLLSVAIESLITPRPPLARPWPEWGVHAGLCFVAHAALTLLLGRPWFAAVLVSAFLLMLALVNNAKVKALREPFVFQDYEYFTDAIRHPRLYIPFMGVVKFLLATAGFVFAIGIGLWGEAAPVARFAWAGQLGGVLVSLAAGAALLMYGACAALPVTMQPERDIETLGFLASLWRYAGAARKAPDGVSPFAGLKPAPDVNPLPHLVAVQSESFFDVRALYAGIDPAILSEYDRLKHDAALHGKLTVPAWGANTVRTEFAFLTGIDAAELGAHRFNPYRAMTAGWEVASLTAFLKRIGYRTVCVHPYPASFYQRHRVFPRLGFDAFLDIAFFENAAQFKPYVGDEAVAAKVASILDQDSGPMFVFVITMENHGPLHLETPEPGEIQRFYSEPPPSGCNDLTIYLRHLDNADRMVASLRRTLAQCDRPAGLCWYGDHVPTMPAVYQTFGVPEGAVEFVLWDNRQGAQGGESRQRDLDAHQLSRIWLQTMGIIA